MTPSLDLKHLGEAMNRSFAGKPYCSALRREDQIVAKALCFTNSHRHFSFPLSSEIITELSDNASIPIEISSHHIQVKSSEHTFHDLINSCSSRLVSSMFKVDLDKVVIPILGKLERFVLCYSNQSFTSHFYQDKLETLGKLLVFLPMESGFLGNLTIDQGTERQKETHRLHDDGTQRSFMVIAMTGTRERKQCYSVQAAAVHPIAFMEFSLIWTLAPIQKSLTFQNIPSFILKVGLIDKALSFWNTSQGSNETGKDKPFCYCLSNTYSINNFSTSELNGDDLFAFEAFRALPYVDVCLGLVTVTAIEHGFKTNTLSYWGTKFPSFDKSQISDVDILSFNKLNGRMLFDNNMRNFIPFHLPTEVRNAENRCTVRPVLIIQPKWVSSAQHPKLFYMPLLNSLNTRSPEAGQDLLRGLHTLRNFLIADVKRLICAVAGDVPVKVTHDECPSVFNVGELLDYCINFKAVDEGLLLVNCVAYQKCACGTPSLHGDATTKAVFARLADFVLNVAGWDVSMNSVIYLTNNSELCTEMIDMARELHLRRCHGTPQLLDIILYKLNAANEYQVDALSSLVVQLAVWLIESEDLKTRMASVRACIQKLTPLKLVEVLEQLISHRRDGLFEDIKSLIYSINLATIPEESFIKLLKTCRQAQNSEFLDAIWTRVRDECKSGLNHELMLNRLVTKLTMTSERVDVLDSVGDLPVAQLVIDLVLHLFSCLTGELESRLSYCIFMCTVENDKRLANEYRLKAFYLCFKRLSTRELSELTLKFYRQDEENIMKSQSSFAMCKKLLEELTERNSIDVMQETGRHLPSLVRALLQLNEALFTKFVARIVRDRKSESSTDRLRTLLAGIRKIFNTDGIYGESIDGGPLKVNAKDAKSLVYVWLSSATTLGERREFAMRHKNILLDGFKAYFKAEKLWLVGESHGIRARFIEFAKGLNFTALVHVIGGVSDEEISDKEPSLKKFAAFQSFKEMFRDLLARPEIARFAGNVPAKKATSLIAGLLWIDDCALISEFSRILSSPTQSVGTGFIEEAIHSETVRDLAMRTPVGSKFILKLIDRLTAVTEGKLRRSSSYSLSFAYSDNPELDSFLRSSSKQMTYYGDDSMPHFEPKGILSFMLVSEENGKKCYSVMKTKQNRLPREEAEILQAKLSAASQVRRQFESVRAIGENEEAQSLERDELMPRYTSKRARVERAASIL